MGDYNFTPVSFPHTEYTQPQGINDNGDVVGYYQNGLQPPQGFVLKSGTYTVITGLSGSTAVMAYGINNSGQIVGSDNPSGQAAAFLLSGGVYSDVGYPGCPVNVAVAISNDGKIVGTCTPGTGGPFNYLLVGGNYSKLPDAGQPATPTGINVIGQIVGNFGSSAGFLLTGNVYSSIPGPPGSIMVQASGINDNGQIVGYDQSTVTGSLSNHGFVLSAGAYTTIDINGQPLEQFFGINNNLWVVGDSAWETEPDSWECPR